MDKGGGAGVLNRTDDRSLLAARVARKAAGTPRIYAADPGRGSGCASAKLAESDGAVVGGGAGGAEVAVEQLRRCDAVDAVVSSVTATST